MDANCIWAGDATVTISLSRAGKAAETRELHTQASGSAVSYGGYLIQLTALAPYPKVNRQIGPSDYVATFILQAP